MFVGWRLRAASSERLSLFLRWQQRVTATVWVSGAACWFSSSLSRWQQSLKRGRRAPPVFAAPMLSASLRYFCRHRLPMGSGWSRRARLATNQNSPPSDSCGFTTPQKPRLDRDLTCSAACLFLVLTVLNPPPLSRRGWRNLAGEMVQSGPFLLKTTPRARSVTGSSAAHVLPLQRSGSSGEESGTRALMEDNVCVGLEGC